MKFYEQAGTYRQSRMKYLYLENTLIDEELEVSVENYTVPTRYLSYSIDRKVS